MDTKICNGLNPRSPHMFASPSALSSTDKFLNRNGTTDSPDSSSKKLVYPSKIPANIQTVKKSMIPAAPNILAKLNNVSCLPHSPNLNRLNHMMKQSPPDQSNDIIPKIWNYKCISNSLVNNQRESEVEEYKQDDTRKKESIIGEEGKGDQKEEIRQPPRFETYMMTGDLMLNIDPVFRKRPPTTPLTQPKSPSISKSAMNTSHESKNNAFINGDEKDISLSSHISTRLSDLYEDYRRLKQSSSFEHPLSDTLDIDKEEIGKNWNHDHDHETISEGEYAINGTILLKGEDILKMGANDNEICLRISDNFEDVKYITYGSGDTYIFSKSPVSEHVELPVVNDENSVPTSKLAEARFESSQSLPSSPAHLIGADKSAACGDNNYTPPPKSKDKLIEDLPPLFDANGDHDHDKEPSEKNINSGEKIAALRASLERHRLRSRLPTPSTNNHNNSSSTVKKRCLDTSHQSTASCLTLCTDYYAPPIQNKTKADLPPKSFDKCNSFGNGENLSVTNSENDSYNASSKNSQDEIIRMNNSENIDNSSLEFSRQINEITKNFIDQNKRLEMMAAAAVASSTLRNNLHFSSTINEKVKAILEPTSSISPVSSGRENDYYVIEKRAARDFLNVFATNNKHFISLDNKQSNDSFLENGESDNKPECSFKVPIEEEPLLLKRLYHLDGFDKCQVARCLNNMVDSNERLVEEYFNEFSYEKIPIDAALRNFFLHVSLVGENCDREKTLKIFSKYYYQFNPSDFISEDSLHILVCALVLLNTDFYICNIGKKMSCKEFITNLTSMGTYGKSYNKTMLKKLYLSIKEKPLQGAIDKNVTVDNKSGKPDNKFLEQNSYLTLPPPFMKEDIAIKQGFLRRKCCKEANGRKSSFIRRNWRTFFATLRGRILYLNKGGILGEDSFLGHDYNSIRLHHALATKSSEYVRKPFVFQLQTADWAIYFFQAGNLIDMENWIESINLISATLSALPLPSPIESGRNKKFHKPLLPSLPTKYNMLDQLKQHEYKVIEFEQELQILREAPPAPQWKTREIVHFKERENYYLYELKRYKTYATILQRKLMKRRADTSSSTPVVVLKADGKTSLLSENKRNALGDSFSKHLTPSSHSRISNNQVNHISSVRNLNGSLKVDFPSPNLKNLSSLTNSSNFATRTHSDRYSYKAAIYKTETERNYF
ncbi:unnamed protein product [Gordionus sp. m RMFG-2023]